MSIWHIWSSWSFALLLQNKWFILSLWLYSPVVTEGKQVSWTQAEAEVYISVIKIWKFCCEYLEVFVWKLDSIFLKSTGIFILCSEKDQFEMTLCIVPFNPLQKQNYNPNCSVEGHTHILKGDDYPAYLSLVYPNSVYFLL